MPAQVRILGHAGGAADGSQHAGAGDGVFGEGAVAVVQCSAHRDAYGVTMTMPKLTVSNYPEMLRKLSTAILFVTIGCLALLRTNVVPIDQNLQLLDVMTPAIPVFGPIKIPFGTFFIAFAFACISESVKLHDKISDVLKIRHEFDVRWILIPMALLSGAILNTAQFERLKLERRRLMGDAFYAYASSTPGRQVIDPHTITQALTSWSWYWLCAEAIVVIIPTAAALAYAGHFQYATALLAIVLALMLVMRFFRIDCSRYADSQIQQILNDNGRRSAVATIFNAL
jgi:hypothetical protein